MIPKLNSAQYVVERINITQITHFDFPNADVYKAKIFIRNKHIIKYIQFEHNVMKSN